MNLPDQDPKVRAWKKQADLPFFDQSHLPDRDYAYANILGPSANRSRRHVNNTTVFCAIVLLLGALAMIF